MSEEPRKLRKRPEEVSAVLNQMDERPVSQRDLDARQAERHTYRLTAMQVELATPDGRYEKHLVPSRNISREGASFLMGHFVYPGTQCRLQLVSIHGNAYPVTAKIMHCRYLMGSGAIHEVGVKFQQAIDVDLFHQDIKNLNILLVDDDPAMPQLVRGLLKSSAIEVTYADNGQAGCELASEGPFDLVMLDIDMPGMSGLDAALKMRQAGYKGPLVAVTAMTRKEDRQRCFEAGCTHYVPKPLSRDRLMNLVRSATREPLVSALSQDKDLAQLIDDFVVSLPDKLGELQGTLAADDLDTFGRSVRMIKSQAGSFGFDVISDIAQELENMLYEQKEIEALQQQLVELTRWCHLARPKTQPGCDPDPPN